MKDATRARELATRLDQLNAERQEEERRIVQAIEARIADDPALREAYCMVIDGDGWHRGVIGITATRVVERYGRPALVISRNGDEAHGSGRSIRPFHLLNALESCSHLFTRFGGHSHAVGFSLPCDRVAELRAHLDEYARARLTLADFEPSLQFDAELSFAQITPELFQLVQRLEPFGSRNPEPVFVTNGARLLTPARVMKEKHIKLKLTENRETGTANGCSTRAWNALGWRMAERWQKEQFLPGDVLDIAFTLDHNDHPDFGGLELSLKDFKGQKLTTEATEVTEKQVIPQPA